jgi:hypothetical protein
MDITSFWLKKNKQRDAKSTFQILHKHFNQNINEVRNVPE